MKPNGHPLYCIKLKPVSHCRAFAGDEGGAGAVPAARDEPGGAGLPGVPAVGRVRDDARRQLRQAHHRGA